MTDAQFASYQQRLGVKQICVVAAILLGSVAGVPLAEAFGLADQDAAVIFIPMRIVGLAFSGYGCCNVARSKNLSPHSYGALGFFMPPVGMTAVLLQKRIESAVDGQIERHWRVDRRVAAFTCRTTKQAPILDRASLRYWPLRPNFGRQDGHRQWQAESDGCPDRQLQ